MTKLIDDECNDDDDDECNDDDNDEDVIDNDDYDLRFIKYRRRPVLNVTDLSWKKKRAFLRVLFREIWNSFSLTI